MGVVSSSFRARVRSSIEEPVARFFGRLGFSPNALTLIGFGIAVVGAYLAATQSWLLAGIVVAFGAVFDLFDGALARATGKTSKLGAFMDSTFDRAGEAVVYVGIAAGFVAAGLTDGALLAAAAMAASFMVSYTRAKSEALGLSSGSGMASVGLAPREVRTVILTVALIAAGAFGDVYPVICGFERCPMVMGIGAALIMTAVGVIAILATLTTIQRIYFAYRQSKTPNNESPNQEVTE